MEYDDYSAYSAAYSALDNDDMGETDAELVASAVSPPPDEQPRAESASRAQSSVESRGSNRAKSRGQSRKINTRVNLHPRSTFYVLQEKASGNSSPVSIATTLQITSLLCWSAINQNVSCIL